MKTRTIFNILGPLINPAHPNIELMGVYSEELVRPIAETMLQMGMKRAAVVHGSGLDEVAIHGPTTVAEIKDGQIVEYTLTPQDFGLETHPLEAIKGGAQKRIKQSSPIFSQEKEPTLSSVLSRRTLHCSCVCSVTKI